MGRTAAQVVEVLLRIAFAAVYAYAAVGKIEAPYDFARAVYNYRLLPEAAIVPVALGLPVLEILAAAAILTGFLYRGAALVLAISSAAFAAAIASAIVRGIDLSCGCFGTHAEASADWAHVAWNGAALIAAVWLLARTGVERVRPLWPRSAA